MTCLRLGIDEAGRGCVLGPMIFGACLVRKEDEEHLRAIGTRDSKRLSPKRRETLRSELEGLVMEWRTIAIGAEAIDSQSLNELGKEAIVQLVVELRPDVVVVDAPVPPRGIPAYSRDLHERLSARGAGHVRIVAENKADDNHPCCSAASIFAKTTRDLALAELSAQSGRNLGSGYPSDPRTRAFLEQTWEENQNFPPWVRTKWETVRRIVAKSSQGRLF
jgi:ribonuclease HII